MKMNHVITAVCCIAVLLISLASCSSAEIEERHTLLGVIHDDIVPPHEDARVDIAGYTVSIPELFSEGIEVYYGIVEVRAGVPFDVTVHTFAAPRCHEAEQSHVFTLGAEAYMYVYDSGPVNNPCIAMLILLPRTETFVFSEPGEAEVIIRGARSLQRPYELRFPVVVKP